MPEATKTYTLRVPAELAAAFEECAAAEHRSVNSLLWLAGEQFIAKWRASRSREQAELIASLTKDAALEVVLQSAARTAREKTPAPEASGLANIWGDEEEQR